MDNQIHSSFFSNNQYTSPSNLNYRIALHEKFSTNPIRWTDWVYQHLALVPGQRVLAVGCGNATQWRDNAPQIPTTTLVSLMDLSMGMLFDAQRGIGGTDQRFKYLGGDAQQLPFAASIFDRVTANHMLYHVPSIEKAVAEFARVIKTEGVLMATTNGKHHMMEFFDLLAAFDPSFSFSERPNRRFCLHSGQACLEDYFTEVWKVNYDSDLWVTDSQALVDYAFSMWDVQDSIVMEKAKAMQHFFDLLIQKDGGIRITKEVGLFLACQTPGLIDSLGILKAK